MFTLFTFYVNEKWMVDSKSEGRISLSSKRMSSMGYFFSYLIEKKNRFLILKYWSLLSHLFLKLFVIKFFFSINFIIFVKIHDSQILDI